MENEHAQESVILPQQEKPVEKPIKKRKRMMLLALLIVVSFAFIFLGLLLTRFLSSSSKNYQDSHTKQSYISSETTVTSFFGTPELYLPAQWQMIKRDIHDEDGMNQLMAFSNNDYLFIKELPGTFWKAEKPLEYPSVEVYYEDYLMKQGWAPKLQFDTFTLENLVADSPCGGVRGYLAYKDGFIRFITIDHEYVVCGQSANQGENTEKLLMNYTLFISDPISLEEIVEKIK